MRKPIKLNEAITQNDVDFALMKNKYTKRQIQEAISYWERRLNEDFGNNVDEGLIKTGVDFLKTKAKETWDYTVDAAKAVGGDVLKTFIASKNIKLFAKAVQSAKAKSPDKYTAATIEVKAAGKKYVVTDVVFGKNLGKVIIFECKEDGTGTTLQVISDKISEKKGANFKVQSDYDAICVSFDNTNIKSGEKLTYKKIELTNGHELKVYRGNVKSVSYVENENVIVMEMEKTTQEKHKEAAADIWS